MDEPCSRASVADMHVGPWHRSLLRLLVRFEMLIGLAGTSSLGVGRCYLSRALPGDFCYTYSGGTGCELRL